MEESISERYRDLFANRHTVRVAENRSSFVYRGRHGERKRMEVWKSNREVQTVPAGTLLRIQANAPFLLHWTIDDWQNSTDMRSQGTAIGIEFVDIPLSKTQKNPIQFTFLWLDEDRWEGTDYKVNVREQEATAHRTEDHRRRKKTQGKRPATVG
jgi:hypothetical protein